MFMISGMKKATMKEEDKKKTKFYTVAAILRCATGIC